MQTLLPYSFLNWTSKLWHSAYNDAMLKSVISCPCQTNWISCLQCIDSTNSATSCRLKKTYLKAKQYKTASNSRRQHIHRMKNMFCSAEKVARRAKFHLEGGRGGGAPNDCTGWTSTKERSTAKHPAEKTIVWGLWSRWQYFRLFLSP